MTTADVLEQARESFARQAWTSTVDQLTAAERNGATLTPYDLECLATALHLTGRYADLEQAWERAHLAYLAAGDAPRAVRCCFWLAFGLFDRGDEARGGGWMARAARLLEECGQDCVEQGYLVLPQAIGAIDEHDDAGAFTAFNQIGKIAERFGDGDLRTFARMGRGHALVRLGEVSEGVALLDEAMVSVLAGELSPLCTGLAYCATLEVCEETHDVRRALEWTSAFTRWCDAQPDLVPYRGNCQVHRVNVLQFQGAWPEALDAARRACELLTTPMAQGPAALAYYQLGELYRLRGEAAAALDAYRRADELGHSAYPGLALLRLAQGKAASAEAAIRRVVAEARGHSTRLPLLPAYVEILLAAGDVTAARAAAEELEQIADALEALPLRAAADHALGSVLLAEGDARSAHAELCQALRTWQDLGAPYEAARTRVVLARTCTELGDTDSAQLELDAARMVFSRLGAAPDLAQLEAPASTRRATRGANGLTAREVEVLGLVASGRTNRAIAEHLVLSEKTVARHVSNIFTKLGLSSRAAATAYAYEHDLV